MSESAASKPSPRLNILGHGIDLVHIPAFAEQLSQPGTRFGEVFSSREQRVAQRKPPALKHEHLAGRWAAKEAFIKAFSQAIYGQPPLVAEEHVNFQDIEVAPDAWSRVTIQLSGQMQQLVEQTLGDVVIHVSISHDGDYATASCIVAEPPQTR